MTAPSRPWLMIGMLALLPALASCSAESPAADAPPSVTDDQPAPPAEAVELPCGAAEPAELDAIFGTAFGDGSVGSSTITENDLVWTADSCTWAASDTEVRVRIAGSEDFSEGFVCLEPLGIASDPEQVSGIGDQAWWLFDDFSGAEGELRVCTGETLIEVLIEAESGDSATLRDHAVELAELTISRL